jgi:hypothetical protein
MAVLVGITTSITTTRKELVRDKFDKPRLHRYELEAKSNGNLESCSFGPRGYAILVVHAPAENKLPPFCRI